MKIITYLLLSTGLAVISALHTMPYVLYTAYVFKSLHKGVKHNCMLDIAPIAYLAAAAFLQHRWRVHDESIAWIIVSLSMPFGSAILLMIAAHMAQSRARLNVSHNRYSNGHWNEWFTAKLRLRLLVRLAAVVVPMAIDIVLGILVLIYESKIIKFMWIWMSPSMPVAFFMMYSIFIRPLWAFQNYRILRRLISSHQCVVCEYPIGASAQLRCPECGSLMSQENIHKFSKLTCSF